MICENCHEKPATVHLTDVTAHSKHEIHLCEDCAKKQGVTIKSYMHKEPAGPDLVSQLVASPASETAGGRDRSCDTCGTTYRNFRSTGKFGCPGCYRSFRQGLVSLLEKIHGRAQHVGKVPLRASDQIARQKELRTLRVELERAVRDEAYEEAARIRDRINDLEGSE